MRRSKRSSSGAERRRRYRARSSSPHAHDGGPSPHGHGLVHATRRKSAGNRNVSGLARDPHDALLERLAQGVERPRRELAELVEEQAAAVRERDLARRRLRAPTPDQRRDRRGVVRRAERWDADQAAPAPSGGGVDLRDLERLVGRERGQHRREPAGEHRLADAGRPCEQQVMAASRGCLQRAARPREAAHLAEVERLVLVLVLVVARVGGGGGSGHGSSPLRHARSSPRRRAPRTSRVGHQRGLGDVRHRHDDRRSSGSDERGDERQRAGHAADRPVEPELAEHRDVVERGGGELVLRDQHAERDGEVEP